MPTNYGRGAEFERRVAAALQRDGYQTFRSAGSRGKVDILALKPGQILLIQCKRNGEIEREEWNAVVKMRQALDPRGGTAVALLAYMPGARGIAYAELLWQLEPGQRRAGARRAWTPDQITEERER